MLFLGKLRLDISLLTFPRWYFHLCYSYLVFAMCLRRFIAALWSPEGKGLTCWLFVCDIYCGFVTFPFGILGQVWYLIVLVPDPCCLSYFEIACESIHTVISCLFVV